MKRGERAFSLVLLVLSAAVLLASLRIAPLSKLTLTSDGAYPILVSCLSLAFALAVFLETGKRRDDTEGADGRADAEERVFHPDVVVMLLLMAAYLAAILTIHYILATLLFSVLSISYLRGWRWRSGLLIGFTATFWIVLVFKYFFSVILP